MSVRIMTKVWDCEFPTQAVKLVALKLADCANDDGDNIYPSAARVERETGCSTSTVREALALLEAQGLLLVVSEGYNNRQGHSSTIRRFDMERLAALADGRLTWTYDVVQVLDGETGEIKLRPDGKPRTERLWKITPPNTGPLRETAPTPPESGAHPSGIPHPPCTPYKDNPSLNRHSPTARAREVDQIVESLLAGKPQRAAAVTGLIEPIIRQRTFSAPDPDYALGALADRPDVAALDAEALGRVVRAVLDARAATVKPSDIEAAVRAETEAARRAKADVKRKAIEEAAPVKRRVEIGSPEFAAAIERWRGVDPQRAARFEQQGFVMVTEGSVQ